MLLLQLGAMLVMKTYNYISLLSDLCACVQVKKMGSQVKP